MASPNEWGRPAHAETGPIPAHPDGEHALSNISAALQAARKPVSLPFHQWILTIDKTDRDSLNAAATDPGISTRDILDIVKDAGCRVSRDTISAWRKAHGLNR